MIPEGWNTYKIRDLALRIGIGPFGSSIKVETFVDSGMPIISGSNLKNMRLTDIGYNFITNEHADKLRNAIVTRGDVIFTHAGNIGAVSFIPKDSKYERYILSQRNFFLKCDETKLIPEYITYFFKTREGQHKLLANSSSVGVPSIAQPVSYLKNIEVTIPRVEEQKKIVQILSSLDDKIELNLQMNKTLEVIAQSIFKEWFVDFRFPGFDGDLVDGLPSGWTKGMIQNIYNTTSGGTPSRAKDVYFIKGSIKWVKSRELNGSFIIDTEENITEDALNNSSAKILPRHSLLVAMYGATVGEFGILSTEATCNQAICAIIPNDQYPFTYILEYYKLFKKRIINQASGSAQQNISQAIIQQQEILIPTNEIIVLFDKTVAPLYSKIESNLVQNLALQNIRDLLLPKLLTGKIRVA